MLSKFEDMKNKEMICVTDGLKIGYVDDIEFDLDTFTIKHLISYGKSKFFGLLGKTTDIKISCEQIQIIGEDIILVTEYKSDVILTKKKESFLSKLFE